MIKDREQFENVLKNMKKKLHGTQNTREMVKCYNKAIEDILDLIADEGGCFRE